MPGLLIDKKVLVQHKLDKLLRDAQVNYNSQFEIQRQDLELIHQQ